MSASWRNFAGFVGALLTFAFASSATAQTPDVSVGSFRLGMSIEEALAAYPGASAHSQFRYQIAGRDYNADLIFVGGFLDHISFEGIGGGPDANGCFTGFVQLVTALEATSGPLNGEARPGEGSGIALPPDHTLGGSEIRKFRSQSGAYVAVARTSGDSHVLARVLIAEAGPRAYGCIFNVTAGDASNARPTTLPPAPTAEELAAAPRLERPQWVERPDWRTVAAMFPRAALDQSIEGRVELDCLIEAEGTLRCAIAAETPDGYGFGRAALVIATMIRAATQIDGVSTVGNRVRQGITFALP
jgi:hypothetical protein